MPQRRKVALLTAPDPHSDVPCCATTGAMRVRDRAAPMAMTETGSHQSALGCNGQETSGRGNFLADPSARDCWRARNRRERRHSDDILAITATG
jgi:hypothetical protein